MNKRKFIRKSIQITKSDAKYTKDTADAFGITQTTTNNNKKEIINYEK